MFEGASRRVEDPVERGAVSTAESSSAASKAAQNKSLQSPPLVPSAASATLQAN